MRLKVNRWPSIPAGALGGILAGWISVGLATGTAVAIGAIVNHP